MKRSPRPTETYFTSIDPRPSAPGRFLLHLARAILAAGALLSPTTAAMAQNAQLAAANESLFVRLQEVHGLTTAQIEQLRTLFQQSGYIGQGNPKITIHPASEADCEQRLVELSVTYANADFLRICGAPFMAPLYDPETQRPEEATTCIDQFEFPNIPCTYPVVWVRAREAAEICQIMGKRLCDAHEWEGACAGQLLPPDYRFDLVRGQAPEAAIRLMRQAHNRTHSINRVWSYGPEYRASVCGTSGRKSPGCDGGGWTLCGSNTFPSGFFPDCHSELGVYDLNGNAAEHMNLPIQDSQISSRGSKELGYTEMKGSWFIFDTYRAHEDWCRWRAPFWHGTRVMDAHSHHNYHLSFRCCSDVEDAPAAEP